MLCFARGGGGGTRGNAYPVPAALIRREFCCSNCSLDRIGMMNKWARFRLDTLVFYTNAVSFEFFVPVLRDVFTNQAMVMQMLH